MLREKEIKRERERETHGDIVSTLNQRCSEREVDEEREKKGESW